MTAAERRLARLLALMSPEQRGAAMKLEFAAERANDGRKITAEQRLEVAERLVVGLSVSPSVVLDSHGADRKPELRWENYSLFPSREGSRFDGLR